MKNLSKKITWKNIIMFLFLILFLYIIIYFILKDNHKIAKTTISLSQYDIIINENTIIYAKTENNQETIISKENEDYELKLTGETNREYEFTIEDETGKTHSFIYSFDNDENLTLKEK